MCLIVTYKYIIHTPPYTIATLASFSWFCYILKNSYCSILSNILFFVTYTNYNCLTELTKCALILPPPRRWKRRWKYGQQYPIRTKNFTPRPAPTACGRIWTNQTRTKLELLPTVTFCFINGNINNTAKKKLWPRTGRFPQFYIPVCQWNYVRKNVKTFFWIFFPLESIMFYF